MLLLLMVPNGQCLTATQYGVLRRPVLDALYFRSLRPQALGLKALSLILDQVIGGWRGDLQGLSPRLCLEVTVLHKVIVADRR